MNVIGAIGHAFKRFFQIIFGVEGLSALAKAAEELLKTDLGKIAWAAVQAAQGLADKSLAREQAFAQIKTAAEAAGHEVKDSTINLAIELLVQRLKGTFGEVPA